MDWNCNLCRDVGCSKCMTRRWQQKEPPLVINCSARRLPGCTIDNLLFIVSVTTKNNLTNMSRLEECYIVEGVVKAETVKRLLYYKIREKYYGRTRKAS